MTHSTPDPLRETDVPHMHPMEVMARNFRAKQRAALAALQPAPDAVALGQALYDAVHYAAERGDVDSMGIVLRPLWEWHVAFVEPGTAIPEEIKAVPTPQPASADREALVSRLVEAVETLIDAAGTAETTLAHALMDGMIDPNVEDRFEAWLQELIAAAHNGLAARAAMDTPKGGGDA